jgi:hypothetical protein
MMYNVSELRLKELREVSTSSTLNAQEAGSRHLSLPPRPVNLLLPIHTQDKLRSFDR